LLACAQVKLMLDSFECFGSPLQREVTAIS
jgi:hypothetical protein